MDNFAFVIHPMEAGQLARKFPAASILSEKLTEKLLRVLPPFKASDIHGVSSSHNSLEGWFIACPLTSRQMVNLPQELVIKKIIRAGKIAEKLGARILGLGAYTKVVGDAGITVSKALNIPVTTGNSYTIAIAIEGTLSAAKQMGIDIDEAKVVIVGATGSIGKVCSHLLARKAKYITLVGKDENKLEALASEIIYHEGVAARVTTNLKGVIKEADLIITVTSSLDAVIEPEDIKPGAVVCDVARPRDVSQLVANSRDDVMVIEGGIVEVPGDVDFGLNFGFPSRMAYACMAETMILALEGRYESFTLGRDISVRQVEEISQLARKHGFKLAGFRSFDKTLTNEDISRIKINAGRNNSYKPMIPGLMQRATKL